MAQMACDRVQVSRFTGRKVGEHVLSEATGIDPVRSSAARSGDAPSWRQDCKNPGLRSPQKTQHRLWLQGTFKARTLARMTTPENRLKFEMFGSAVFSNQWFSVRH